MRLQSISLFGFKSFADRTELAILPGITAIVGPNGCGKSNISDALRWALGEQSPKALRGQRMEDVIFHGSASRRPLGLAEALLIFSNDGTVAVPWSEISVGRRLYRDGESEYLLNKTVCRLKDVHDLFLGTGVNPKAYALMEQERLAQILTGRPLDRRVFVEEAAGITRYKQQRTETLAKLEATRQNLLRVRDVMDEVKRQLGSLERQARRAKAYKALQAERGELELALLAAQHAEVTQEEAALSARMEAERDRADLARARLAALQGERELARSEVMACEHRAADLRHALQRAELELESCVTRAEELRGIEKELRAEATRLTDEAQTLRERLRLVAADRLAKRALVASLREEFATLQDRAVDQERGLDAIRRGLRASREAAEALRREQVALAGRRTELGQVLGGLEERREQLRRRLERIDAEREQAEAEQTRLTAARADSEARLAAATSAAAAAEARLRESAERIAAVSAERAGRADALEACRVALAARRSSLAAIEELEAQRAGYSDGVQAVFAAARDVELAGLVGTVADLLEVPRDLERAVEAALGERLGWVVVDSFSAAKQALGYLDRRGVGQATFLSLDLLNGGGRAHVDSDEGVLGVASRLVGCEHPTLLANLLGSVVVVRDLGAAERLWGQNGGDTSFVTVSGEVLTPPGALGGGRATPGGDGSLLTRKRAIRDLRASIGELEEESLRVERELQAAEARLADLATEQRVGATTRESAETERIGVAKDLEQLVREADRSAILVEACRAETRQVAAEADEAAEELRQRRENLRELEDASERVAAEIARVLAAIEGDATAEAAGAQAFLDLQIELAGLAGRIEGSEAEGERLAVDESETRERIAADEMRLVALRARGAETHEEWNRLEARAEVLRVERDGAREAAQSAADELETVRARLERLGEDVRAGEAEAGRATHDAHDLAVRVAAVHVRREELAGQARRQFDLSPDDLLGAHDASRDPGAMRERLEVTAEKLASLEPVNLIADDEYRELDERLTFLRTQHDDLSASMRDLDRALRGMTRTAQARFTEAFEAINRNFQEIFGRLFEGGRAELRLTEAPPDGDPMDTGIEMVAQPRGKRLQAISLLSGGEKALTGLALLFAIFYYRPSPFCLLDEVDAPLDDANIHRFTKVLRELATQTQFIVITHNRKTMEAADVLYGVTMEEPGLSGIVSVNLG
jgi:chromosome segregation protein